jgi:hypothetical protein
VLASAIPELARDNPVYHVLGFGYDPAMDSLLPVPTGRRRQVATLDQLAAIPEKEIWLAKQKSAQTAALTSTTRYPSKHADG